MASLSDLRRAWLLKALGLTAADNLSAADLETQLDDPNRIASAPIQGTGFPEGVVTAPVGTEYVDIAATAGAVKWIKTSGTGNTGWEVTYGDTGLRDIKSLITDPSVDTTYGSMRATVRRVNAVVMLDLEIKTPATVISPVVQIGRAHV